MERCSNEQLARVEKLNSGLRIDGELPEKAGWRARMNEDRSREAYERYKAILEGRNPNAEEEARAAEEAAAQAAAQAAQAAEEAPTAQRSPSKASKASKASSAARAAASAEGA